MPHPGEKLVDVGILGVVNQLESTFFHQGVNLLEVFQFLLGHVDQGGNDRRSIRILDHQAHGQGGGFSLAIGVVAEKFVKMVDYHLDPFGIGGCKQVNGSSRHWAV